MSRFIDFSCFLKSGIAVFTFQIAVVSSGLYCLTSGEKYLSSTLLVIPRPSQSFCGHTCSYFLLPLVAESFSLYARSLHPVEPGPVLDNLPFASPRAVSPGTTESGQLSAHAQLVRDAKPTGTALGSTHTGSRPPGGGVCGRGL